MLTINKFTSNETVDFAASELKKYLRMMMPNDGDVKIAYDPNATDGFRLGLMQDAGLDVSDAIDTELDDIMYIDTTVSGGIIAGDNPRAVLLAVYEFFRQNGCRWLFPGVDGEYIPIKDVEAVSYRHVASCRYRGHCIEGGCTQQELIDLFDFLPKVGMNVFQMQFFIPELFYNRYYKHEKNSKRSPEPLSANTVIQWKTACEAEMSKRGLQFHDVGHGWNIASFGVDTSKGFSAIKNEDLTEEARNNLALYRGKRAFYDSNTLFAQMCLSSESARKQVASYVADYAMKHPNVDYLHVWLGDGHNNHCECDECAKKTVSDWYVVLLNDIDRELTERSLNTRIVFINYNESIWAPVTERIKNPDRFTLMMAPISRSYTTTLTGKEVILPPFVRNDITGAKDLDTFMAHYKEWRKVWKGAALAFEYHFWRYQYCDPSGMFVAKRIFEDIECYKDNDLDGLIACGCVRSFFPTGFPYYVFARKQYDISLSFDDILKDYFACAFGQDWEKFVDYLNELSECLGPKYLNKGESADPSISPFYNPARAEKLRRTPEVLAKGDELIRTYYNSEDRIKTVSVRLLEEHAKHFEILAKMFSYKADNEVDKALKEFDNLVDLLGAREVYYQQYFDYPISTFHWLNWLNDKSS